VISVEAHRHVEIEAGSNRRTGRRNMPRGKCHDPRSLRGVHRSEDAAVTTTSMLAPRSAARLIGRSIDHSWGCRAGNSLPPIAVVPDFESLSFETAGSLIGLNTRLALDVGVLWIGELAARKRDEHGRVLAVAAILVAELLDQIVLF
jgi:hypothetical protein